MNKERADVVVIGGGVIGTSVAYYLAKGGVDVLLVEKGRLGNGSSSGCDGFVIMQSKTPGPHLDMALASEVSTGLWPTNWSGTSSTAAAAA